VPETNCPALNQDSNNPGRCGPLFGGKRCNKGLVDYAVYCNADNGWCGVTDAHKNAQADDKYDWRPQSCMIPVSGAHAVGEQLMTQPEAKDVSAYYVTLPANYLIYVVFGLLALNIVCLAVNCCGTNRAKSAYRVVKFESEPESDV
jgi:hypothetical protein